MEKRKEEWDMESEMPHLDKTRLSVSSVNIIALDDLKVNKRAAGRHKDLEDIEHISNVGLGTLSIIITCQRADLW